MLSWNPWCVYSVFPAEGGQTILTGLPPIIEGTQLRFFEGHKRGKYDNAINFPFTLWQRWVLLIGVPIFDILISAKITDCPTTISNGLYLLDWQIRLPIF
jgi:hypothetical protein